MLNTGEKIYGHEAVGTMFRSWQSGAKLQVVEKQSDGTVFASADGRTFHRGVWHTSEHSDGDVWVEVWKLGTCVFHGCVDSTSRCVTQTG
jgi:hypothetical protein